MKGKITKWGKAVWAARRARLAGAAGWAWLLSSLPQEVSAAKSPDSFLASAVNTLSITIGVPVFIIGVIIVGYNLIMGNEGAVKKGAYVLGGGAVILLAEPIVKMIKSLAGA